MEVKTIVQDLPFAHESSRMDICTFVFDRNILCHPLDSSYPGHPSRVNFQPQFHTEVEVAVANWEGAIWAQFDLIATTDWGTSSL